VEAIAGREFDPNLDAADREAIADVRDALGAWHRYAYSAEPEDADLIIVISKGRMGANQTGSIDRSQIPQPASAGQRFPASTRPDAPSLDGADSTMADSTRADPTSADPTVSGGEDQFEVFQPKPNGKLGKSLWSRSLRDGLSEPRMLLFDQFKQAVEHAYPSPPPPSQTTSPNQKP
jgi:hypothetical protein